jgi:hypothetical protein
MVLVESPGSRRMKSAAGAASIAPSSVSSRTSAVSQQRSSVMFRLETSSLCCRRPSGFVNRSAQIFGWKFDASRGGMTSTTLSSTNTRMLR